MKTFRLDRVLITSFLLTSSLFATASPVGLVPANAVWKYLADGTDPGMAWRSSGFDDSSWPSGPAQLGYGESDEATTVNTPSPRPVTVYFRRSVFIPSGTDLTLRLLRDDGAVVYLNGVEVRRDNLPAGAINFQTLATVAVGGTDESTFFESTIPASAVVPGTNVIAVEVHQNSIASSDMSFALELIVDFGPPGPLVTVVAIDSEAREISPLLDIPENPAAFRVARSGGTSNALTVILHLSGTASNGIDYHFVSNSLTIPAGSASAEVLVHPIDDSHAEGTETVVLRVVPAPCPECYVIGTNSSATVYILDNESSNAPPTVTIFMPLDGATFTAPANITVGANANDANGYLTVQTVEFFANGQSLGVRTNLPVLNPIGPFVIHWSNVSTGHYALTAVAKDETGAMGTSAPVRITVRSEPPVEETIVEIVATDANAREPGVLTIIESGQFAIRRRGNLSSAVPVSFTLGGTASNGLDYTFLSNRVVIPAGATQALVNVVPRSDTLVEETETVLLTLEFPICIAVYPPPPECYTIGSSGQATVFINDAPMSSNRPPVVAITSPTNGAVFVRPTDVHIEAFTRDVDGYANRVEFFANNQKIGEAEVNFIQPPPPDQPIFFDFTWTNPPPGQHVLRASTTDDRGAVGTSAPVNITVTGGTGGTNFPVVRELHVVGIYSGLYNGGSSPNHQRGDAYVVVDRPGKLVTLFLSAYEPVLWHLSINPGTAVEAVFLAGYYQQDITGLPPGTPLIRTTEYIGHTLDCASFYLSVPAIHRLTGMEISSFHGSYTATDPFIINSVQNDPRLRLDFPQPVPASEVPNLSFQLAFHPRGSGGGDVSFQNYTLQGPATGTGLLPAMRVYADPAGRFSYGVESHEVWRIDTQTHTSAQMQLPPGLPEFSWAWGGAYDTQRNRFLVVSFGGEGYLYGYSPPSQQWSVVRNMEHRDLGTIVYHAATDQLFGLSMMFSECSRFVLHRLTASGEPLSETPLPIVPFGRYGVRAELASVGDYLVLLLESRDSSNGALDARIYLVDPRTGQLWLTYRSAAGRDSDHDGVPDERDHCPNTTLGASVDANGCSADQRDSDHDSVPDSRDQCPNTPPNVVVDEHGCSAAQRDSDGDGVPNDRDQCPNTPPGTIVDAHGCPPSPTNCPPAVQWQLSFGGSESDGGRSIQQTTDGGYILGGLSYSGTNGNRTSPGFGRADFWVVRLDAQGHKLWDRTFGGSDYDFLHTVKQTPDGGFILSGESYSGTDGNKTSPNRGEVDFWLVRLDANGNKLWDQTYGGTRTDAPLAMEQTADGGFVLGGLSYSEPGGNKTSPNYGGSDFWVVRTDANGNKLWDASFGGSYYEYLYGLTETTDGGFLIGGMSDSYPGGNKTSPSLGLNDYWVVRLNSQGQKVWEQAFGGSDHDILTGLQQTSDGGFVLAGSSASAVGPNKTSPNYGGSDFWVVRLDPAGNKLWEHSFGGGGDDNPLGGVALTIDGGFLVGGSSRSPSPGFGAADMWLVRLDGTGHKLWEQSFGGIYDEALRSFQQTSDGGFILFGESSSPVSGNKTAPPLGDTDYWVLKLGPEGSAECDDDGDGVPNNEDRCPNTRAGAVVNEDGCSIAQIAPCDGTWRNHGHYVNAVREAAADFYEAGLITKRQRQEIINAAARSDCGRRAPRLSVPAQGAAEIRANGCRLVLDGDGPITCVIECSENLIQWTPISTNTLSGAAIDITDPGASGAPRRFYRVRSDLPQSIPKGGGDGW